MIIYCLETKKIWLYICNGENDLSRQCCYLRLSQELIGPHVTVIVQCDSFMYNTDSTSQVAQIKGITGLNVRCSAVEDESSRSTSPWGLWVVKLVHFLYIPVSRLYTAYRWLARSQWTCVNWGTNTIKNHKKVRRDKLQRPLKKMNGDFVLTLCWKFSLFKTLTFNTL